MLTFLIAATFTAEAQDGPLSKFDEKPPAVTITSTAKLEDLERCLIDLRGMTAPAVYRQPDRPDDVTILWKSPYGISVGRIDLRRQGTGTIIRSWFTSKPLSECTKDR